MNYYQKKPESNLTALFFIIVPTLMLIVGYFLNPYPPQENTKEIINSLLLIPIFLGLILLGIGFLIKKKGLSNKIKIGGWAVFAFYWSTQPAHLYLAEDYDIFNASVCIIGVYVLFYLAYHEWLSLKREENISCLNWIAGASFLAGIIYYGIERSSLADWLIKVVANQSVSVFNFIFGNAEINGDIILFNGNTVRIIFACTAIQSAVIFVGMIGALSKANIKRRVIALLVTVIPVYILNLFRNDLVIFLYGNNITDFFMAHNVISKAGSLIALIVLLFIVIKIIPEVFDEIIGLTDLPKRNGPIELAFKKIFWRKKLDENS